MFKLLALLFVVKLYAGNDIFKEIFDIVLNETWSIRCLKIVTTKFFCKNR